MEESVDEKTPARRKNPFGLASLVVGLLLTLVGIATQATSPAIPYLLERTGTPYQLLPLFYTVPAGVLALITTVLGVIGLLVKDRPRTAAIIGTTLGASTLVAMLLGGIGVAIVGAVVSSL